MPVVPTHSYVPFRTPPVPSADLPPPYHQVANQGLGPGLTVDSVTNRAPLRGWQETRESEEPLRPGDSRLARFPCGALPKGVMKELERALERRQTTDIALRDTRERLGAMMQEATARQEHPSAPSLVIIGGGLHGDDAVHAPHSHRDIQRLQKRVDELAQKKQRLAKRHQDEMNKLELRFLKLEARSRKYAPPADPPAAGYLPQR